MKRGDILFIRGNSFISKFINKVDGPYSHVAFALSEHTILEAQRFTESRIIKNYHEEYDTLNISLNEEQIDMLSDESLHLIGYDYDYKQIVYTLFNSLFKIARYNVRDKYICSELIVELLYRVKYFNDDEYKKLINSTPNELYVYITKKESCININ